MEWGGGMFSEFLLRILAEILQFCAMWNSPAISERRIAKDLQNSCARKRNKFPQKKTFSAPAPQAFQPMKRKLT